VLGLFALLGIMVLISANSLVTLYLGVELLALSLYAMVAFNRDSGVARRPPSSTSCWARSPRARCCTACR
jgi:formate hydrogenlyase subunit 3/multisubunit Na+/H+ antiporter MnhD subunit